MRFHAAVLREHNAPLAIETAELGALQPHDVLVRLQATGLCHTDLEAIQGSLPYPRPIVLGHEGAGTVEAVGSSVASVRKGDLVVCSWNPHCGTCFYCERSLPILCEPYKRNEPRGLLLDGTRRLKGADGPINHFFTTSTFAEYTIVHESSAIAMPEGIAPDRACIIGCAVMTGIGAVTRKAKVAPGSSVVVLGCGAVGLNAVQGAVLASAERIIAADRDASRLALAARLGATDRIAAGGELPERVRALTAGRGADYVIEAAGSAATFRTSVEAVRPGGTVVWLGKINVDQEVSFRWGSLMGEKRIVRSSYGAAVPARDFPWIANAYLRGRVKLDEMITARIRLDQINEGFRDLARGTGIRTVVEF